MRRPSMKPSAYRTYLLAVLASILAFNYVDRLALGLALQNIKLDLGASDTELGLLTGIAFALFYSVLGIPIGRWADRGNRITIIAVTTGIWSIMVMLSGIARSFLQLLFVRIGVAVGEAGCMPPAYSLIADYFNRADRPRAMAIYMLGGSLSAVIGYFCAGWLNQVYGWRIMFMLIGVPGTLLAALTSFTLREPRTRLIMGQADIGFPGREDDRFASHEFASGTAEFGLKRTLATLWKNVTFRHLLMCLCLNYFFGFGISQWQPAFFIRTYGLKTGELGTWFAITYGLGGMLGTYLGGQLASSRAAHNERLQLVIVALVFSCFGLISAFVYLVSNYFLAFGLIALASFGGNIGSGPILATVQTVVPRRMRAISIAIVFLFANLLGMGLGPLVVGALSDALKPFFGAESLRFALLAICPGYFWGGWHVWRASRTVHRDLELTTEDDPQSPGDGLRDAIHE
jgi:MFS family permease